MDNFLKDTQKYQNVEEKLGKVLPSNFFFEKYLSENNVIYKSFNSLLLIDIGFDLLENTINRFGFTIKNPKLIQNKVIIRKLKKFSVDNGFLLRVLSNNLLNLCFINQKRKFEELKVYIKNIESIVNTKDYAIKSNNCVYNKIISLGYNCEVSWRIMDFLDQDFSSFDSFPFSWIYIPPNNYSNSLRCVYDLSLFKQEFCVKDSMLYFKPGVGVHTKFKNSRLVDQSGLINNEACILARNEIVSRFAHLADKFKNLNRAELKLMFVLKYDFYDINAFNNEILLIKSFFKEILSLPQKFLLVVIENKHWNRLFDSPICDDDDFYIVVDSVNSFSFPHDTDIGGDITGWMELISYYSTNLFSDRNRRLNNISNKIVYS